MYSVLETRRSPVPGHSVEIRTSHFHFATSCSVWTSYLLFSSSSSEDRSLDTLASNTCSVCAAKSNTIVNSNTSTHISVDILIAIVYEDNYENGYQFSYQDEY